MSIYIEQLNNNYIIIEMILEALIALVVLYSLLKIYRRKKSHPDYTGKTVWITGASSGIGEYLAYQFNRAGADLIISARNAEELNRVKESCQNPEKVRVVRMDMADYDAVRAITNEVIEDLEKNHKKLDVVVENAGVSMRCQFKDYSFKNHIQLFDVNVHGPYNHIQCFIDHMIKHKSGQIVGITSLAGKLSTAYRSSYAGTKHAFIGILDTLRTEFQPYGIHVCNIMPGYVKTNLSKNAYAANEGQKFNATDSNIEKGMAADVFAREAVKAIFMRENELQISDIKLVPLILMLRGLIPDLVFFGLRKNSANQAKAIKEGKKDN